MTTFLIGDSIAVGMGRSDPTAKTYATGSMAVRGMDPHFTAATALAQEGDIAVIRAGYNGGINAADREKLTRWIRDLNERGTRVVIAGLREDFSNGGPYAHLAGVTPAINETLRDIARETGATFAEETIAVANSIAGGEIHGKSSQLRAAALAAVGSAGAPTPAPTAEEETVEQRNRRLAVSADAPEQTNGLLAIILAIFSALFGSRSEPAEPAEAAEAVTPTAPTPTASSQPAAAAPTSPTTPTQSAAIPPQVAAQARAALSAPPLTATNESLPRLRPDAVTLSV